jgi:hypothetical protein
MGSLCDNLIHCKIQFDLFQKSSWVFAVAKVDQRKILKFAGLDAYFMLRFIRFCYNFCIFGTLMGLVVLTPLYGERNITLITSKSYLGFDAKSVFFLIHTLTSLPSCVHPPATGHAGAKDVHRFTINNLHNSRDDARLWLVVICAYASFIHFMYLVKVRPR